MPKMRDGTDNEKKFNRKETITNSIKKGDLSGLLLSNSYSEFYEIGKIYFVHNYSVFACSRVCSVQ